MSFTAKDGKIVRLVEEEVADESGLEQQLQNEMDEAQNELNTHQANLTAAEDEAKQLEAALEAKESEVEDHRAKVEAAQGRVTKSVDDRNAWDAAKQLRDEQSVAQESPDTEEDSNGAEEEPAADSEAVEIPVAVAAEG